MQLTKPSYRRAILIWKHYDEETNKEEGIEVYRLGDSNIKIIDGEPCVEWKEIQPKAEIRLIANELFDIAYSSAPNNNTEQ
jgi:hypothetical protein